MSEPSFLKLSCTVKILKVLGYRADTISIPIFSKGHNFIKKNGTWIYSSCSLHMFNDALHLYLTTWKHDGVTVLVFAHRLIILWHNSLKNVGGVKF